MKRYPRISLSSCLLAAGSIALAAVLGCQESTGPDIVPPPPGGTVYSPAADRLDVIRGEGLRLSARAVGVDSFRTVFTRGADVLSTEPELNYVPAVIGADSVLATVTYGDQTDEHLWRLQVTGPGLLLPPRPRGFQVIITDQIYITWDGEPGYGGPVPLSRYELRARPRGIVNEANWDSAIPIAEVEFSANRAFYLVVLSVEPPVLPIGAPVGFALRLRDQDGLLSPATRDDVFIPRGMIVEGTVTDIDGRPLENVEVRWSYCDGRTRTDADGRYRSYLLPRNETVGIRYSDDGIGTPGTGDYYDATISWRVESNQVQNVILLPAMSIDPTCGSLRYAGDFLNFMRDMTYTDPGTVPRLHYVTSRWENPPITVWVVERWNDDGTFALNALADSAVATWNERLGETFFVPAADPDSAQLTIYFDNSDLGSSLAVTRIVDPVHADLNIQIPRRMTIQARTTFDESTFAFEVLLHELAHAFCIGGHSRCDAGVHLLQPNPDGIIAARWPASPISDDEVNLIRMIYALSPSHPLDIYRVD